MGASNKLVIGGTVRYKLLASGVKGKHHDNADARPNAITSTMVSTYLAEIY